MKIKLLVENSAITEVIQMNKIYNTVIKLKFYIYNPQVEEAH